MSLMTAAPHITEVNPNSPEFRHALTTAGQILRGTPFSVYSRHRHFQIPVGEVVFERLTAPETLSPVLMDPVEAAQFGLPSCWGVTPTGETVVLRYSDMQMHDGSGVDVASDAFQTQLAEVAAQFAAAGLNEMLELNIAGHLFPASAGRVTSEDTDEATMWQQVTIAPMPAAIAEGDWSDAACFRFDTEGTPYVAGMCSEGCWFPLLSRRRCTTASSRCASARLRMPLASGGGRTLQDHALRGGRISRFHIGYF